MFSVVLSLLSIVTAVLATGGMQVSRGQVDELQFVQSALITEILPRQIQRLGFTSGDGQGCLGYPYKPSYKTISEGIKRVTEDFKTLEGLLLSFKRAVDFEVALKDGNNTLILVLMRMSYKKLVKVVLEYKDRGQTTNMALDRPKQPAFVAATALSTKNKIIPVAPPTPVPTRVPQAKPLCSVNDKLAQYTVMMQVATAVKYAKMNTMKLYDLQQMSD